MNKTRPIYRTCIVTREKLLKHELFRVVLVDKEVVFDAKQTIQGRGVYLKKELEVINLAQKKKMLNKAFKREVGEEIYHTLIRELEKERRD